MSEQLLNAIIRLFALVAKEDDVTQQERSNIQEFLIEHLNEELAEKYLLRFDKLCQDLVTGQEDGEVLSICAQINKELQQQQKLVLILQLTELIMADGDISEREQSLVYAIADGIRISRSETDLLKVMVAEQSATDIDSSQALIIHDGNEDVNVSNLQLICDNLKGFIAILRLVESESYIIKYLGESALYMNGVPLKSKSVQIFSTGSTIKGDKIKPIYYSDVVGKFMHNANQARITFKAENISFKFKTGNLGLRNVNIIEESGRMIGLMGASGSGKSTLLNVLNGNEKPTEGKVLINGYDIHNQPEEIEGLIGYVPQDDLLMEDLSVFQNLYYAAKLCFSNFTEQELENLVNKTLSSLGLSDTRNLKVGSPLEKTISGGQRKRLNIGLELLREPSVLFVDEPTSGLSSRDSENIMDLLKELSLKGKLVFVVIHQPSSDIFKMFDKLVILDVGGYQIYYGNPVEGILYFKNIIETIDREQGSCTTCGNVNPEQIFNIIETKVVNEYGRLTDERKFSPTRWNKYFVERTQLPTVSSDGKLPEITQHIPNKLQQLQVFVSRDLLSKLSNRQYLLINLLEAPLLAFILAYIVRFYQSDANSVYLFSKNMNIPAFFFMSIIVALFMGLTVSAEEIIKDRKILKREAFLHLSRGAYLASKILILFSFSAIQTFFYVLIGDFILEIDGMNTSYWMVLFSVSCFANLLGLNISSAFKSAVTIYILIPILIIPQLMLSGVVVKFDNLNPHISTKDKVPFVGEIMASRWAFEAIMVYQFKENEYGSQFFQFDKAMANAEYRTVYLIPRLETELSYCLAQIKSTDPEVKATVKAKLDMIRNTLQSELEYIEYDQFSNLELIKWDTFNGQLVTETGQVLANMKHYYNRIFNAASDQKDRIIYKLSDTPEKNLEFEQLKNTYYNETIAELVRNTTDAKRIIEHNGRLIQKIYPVYMQADPSNLLQFRAQFYVSEKNLLGNVINTFYFNLLVIWFMSLGLVFTLYFDLLRKLVDRG